jgi:hypothetical protein
LLKLRPQSLVSSEDEPRVLKSYSELTRLPAYHDLSKTPNMKMRFFNIVLWLLVRVC